MGPRKTMSRAAKEGVTFSSKGSLLMEVIWIKCENDEWCRRNTRTSQALRETKEFISSR